MLYLDWKMNLKKRKMMDLRGRRVESEVVLNKVKENEGKNYESL